MPRPRPRPPTPRCSQSGEGGAGAARGVGGAGAGTQHPMRGLETRALSDTGLIPAPRTLTHHVGGQPSPDSRVKGLDSSDLMGSGKVAGFVEWEILS